MGWLYVHKESGMTMLDFFRQEFDWADKERGVSSRVLDCAVKLRVAYLAVERVVGDEREVYGIVVKLDYRPRDEYNLGYKDIDETMSPLDIDCPERILDLLTPTENAYALEWRRKCRERIETRKRSVSLKKGMAIRLREPVGFTDGLRAQEFEVLDARRLIVKPIKGWGRYRLSRRSVLGASEIKEVEA